jgi:hypothetical protein
MVFLIVFTEECVMFSESELSTDVEPKDRPTRMNASEINEKYVRRVQNCN